MSDKQETIEKFVFEINSYKLNSYKSESSCTLNDIEYHLRACLLKLNSIHLIHPPSENYTFSLSIETLQGEYPSTTDTNWIPTDVHEGYKHILPIKSMTLDLFRVSKIVIIKHLYTNKA